MLTDVEKLVLLRDTGLLKHIDSEELYQLLEIAHEVLVKDGEALFRQGERADKIFAIAAGTARLVAEPGARVLGVFSRGRILGEMAMFAGEEHAFSAMAVDGPVAALVFDEVELTQLLLGTPALAFFFLGEIARHNLELLRSMLGGRR
ncbi:MAG: cyclic nucleotide-binding domain-containing protein [Candidatus Wallbacteria bacterium]|nr:cyclic nucleotide-binding domain-containing protein [Candidatus Wallbacteria bacterium]